MKKRPSWVANRFSASQENPRNLLYPKFHYLVSKCPPPVFILSQINPVHAFSHPNYWRTILILPSHLRLGLPNGIFPSGFPTKTLVGTSYPSHTCYMPRPSNCSRFYRRNYVWWGLQRLIFLNRKKHVCTRT